MTNEILNAVRKMQDFEIAEALTVAQLSVIADHLGMPAKGTKLQLAVDIKLELANQDNAPR